MSYRERHNQANGENNRDGHHENFSANHGVEGESKDAAILALRARQSRNLLASLLLSQGTPMLLAGDEFGNSQSGNNNAYCQDNPLGWLDWHRRILRWAPLFAGLSIFAGIAAFMTAMTMFTPMPSRLPEPWLGLLPPARP